MGFKIWGFAVGPEIYPLTGKERGGEGSHEEERKGRQDGKSEYFFHEKTPCVWKRLVNEFDEMLNLVPCFKGKLILFPFWRWGRRMRFRVQNLMSFIQS